MAEPVEETLELSAAEARQISGRGADKVVTVQARTGASVLVVRSDGKACAKIRGAKSSVTKALIMLRAILAFKEAAPEDEQRLACSRFAAGFCQHGQEDVNDCEDGLHSTPKALEQEATWLGKAPSGVAPEGGPLLLALCCSSPGSGFAVDAAGGVCEFALVAVCPTSGKEVGRFHRFVQPSFWESGGPEMRKLFAAACFNDETKSQAFREVLADLLDWLPEVVGKSLDDLATEDLLFVASRDWDVQTLLPRQCNLPQPGTVAVDLQDFFFNRWVCLKDVFRSHFSLPNEAAPTNLRAMLRHLQLPQPQEQHSNCMEDAANIAKILQRFVVDAWEPVATASRDGVTAPTQFLLPSRGEPYSAGPARYSGPGAASFPPPPPGMPAKRNFAAAFPGSQAGALPKGAMPKRAPGPF